jgi:hypothetical protein
MVVALGSYYHFGILQSRFHDVWAWARGSTFKGDLRYTNTTIFEMFPFPGHPRRKYDPRNPPETEKANQVAIAAGAFDRLRAATGKERGLGLTKLHNLLKTGELPELGRAHDALNDAVTACYGFPSDTWRDERESLRRLLELNHRITEPIVDLDALMLNAVRPFLCSETTTGLHSHTGRRSSCCSISTGRLCRSHPRPPRHGRDPR